MTAAPWLMAHAVKGILQKLVADGYNFDLIDAHYFYPDGVAAVILGRALGKPVLITARGTDLNLIPRYFFARRMIKWAAANASALITVSNSLKDILLSLGISEKRVTVLRNGVDLCKFTPPQDRDGLRRSLGLSGRTLLAVGNLIPLKGHELMIRALRHLPGIALMIAGGGIERKNLEGIANALGVADRIRFLGRIEHDRLADFYGAADALILASSQEGWPNVLLESMACGTPIVCTRVGCTPELISAPEAGIIMDGRTPEILARAIENLLASNPDRIATRHYAERFSWEETTLGQIQIFEKVLGHTRRKIGQVRNGDVGKSLQITPDADIETVSPPVN
jgi:glycosyltransferase involved in cell wall biosynthesis